MNKAKLDFAIVTGAGKGLGRALAVELVRRGVHVAGFGRRAEHLAETARLAGSGFSPHVVDVSSAQEVAHAVDQLAGEAGPITILINNAAVYPRRDFLDETPQSFMETVAINLGGMVNCTHAVLGHMVQSGKGRILNVSTFADLSPIPTSSAYAVSKGAARVLTRAVQADVCDRFPGIVINDWMPGMLATDMGIPHGLDPALAARWGAELALWHDPSLTGTVWECDTEQVPARSFKGRIKDRLLRRTRTPRTLGGTQS